MRVKIVAASIAAVLATVGVAGAASLVSGVPASSQNGVKNAVAADGSLKAGAVGHNQIKNHSITKSQIAYGTSLRGPRGFRGKTGLTGAPGSAGPAGAVGPAGAPGAASTVAGPKGATGATGAQGAQGIPGTAAAKGDTGAQGPQGFVGPQGPQGAKGDTGAASTVAGPKGATGAQGEQGIAGPKGDQGTPGTAGMNGAKGDKGDQGIPGAAGTPGAPGVGSQGPAGPAGPKGDKGDQGIQGNQGPQGNPGAAATFDTSVVQVLVSRNSAAATVWAQYRAVLVAGNGTTGGTFRFTCSGTADCLVSVKASATTATTIYPRLLIDREEPLGGATTKSYCEYGDGSTGAAPVATSTTLTTVPVNIGGTADCGSATTTAGDVNVISVPAGHYYDVTTTAQIGS